MPKFKIIAGLDIGTDSIKLLVVKRARGEKDFEVLCQISEPSFGVRRGVVVDVDSVSKIIHSTLSKAQAFTNQKINNVFVNVGGAHIFITDSQGAVAVSRADQRISSEDINRVIQSAQTFSLPSNKEILEVFPQEFVVDGEKGIREPLEMTGIRLEAKVLAVCGFSPYLRNLTAAVLDSGVVIEDLMPSALASARAVLTPKQKELGVAVLDIGAGTSDLAVFDEGNLVHLAVFPFGSGHITNDIAIGLRTNIDVAENIKREFGCCLFNKRTKKNISFQGPLLRKINEETEEELPLVFSQKILNEIIEARVCEIFDETNKELKKVARSGLLPAGVVLTGGGVKIKKIAELARSELRLPCRIGIPQNLMGLKEEPSFATACGLVFQGMDSGEERGFTLGQVILNKIKRIFRIFVP